MLSQTRRHLLSDADPIDQEDAIESLFVPVSALKRLVAFYTFDPNDNQCMMPRPVDQLDFKVEDFENKFLEEFPWLKPFFELLRTTSPFDINARQPFSAVVENAYVDHTKLMLKDEGLMDALYKTVTVHCKTDRLLKAKMSLFMYALIRGHIFLAKSMRDIALHEVHLDTSGYYKCFLCQANCTTYADNGYAWKYTPAMFLLNFILESIPPYATPENNMDFAAEALLKGLLFDEQGPHRSYFLAKPADSQGNTILHIAAAAKGYPIAETIFYYGKSIATSLRDKKGRTPVDILQSRPLEEVDSIMKILSIPHSTSSSLPPSQEKEEKEDFDSGSDLGSDSKFDTKVRDQSEEFYSSDSDSNQEFGDNESISSSSSSPKRHRPLSSSSPSSSSSIPFVGISSTDPHPTFISARRLLAQQQRNLFSSSFDQKEEEEDKFALEPTSPLNTTHFSDYDDSEDEGEDEYPLAPTTNITATSDDEDEHEDASTFSEMSILQQQQSSTLSDSATSSDFNFGFEEGENKDPFNENQEKETSVFDADTEGDVFATPEKTYQPPTSPPPPVATQKTAKKRNVDAITPEALNFSKDSESFSDSSSDSEKSEEDSDGSEILNISEVPRVPKVIDYIFVGDDDDE